MNSFQVRGQDKTSTSYQPGESSGTQWGIRQEKIARLMISEIVMLKESSFGNVDLNRTLSSKILKVFTKYNPSKKIEDVFSKK